MSWVALHDVASSVVYYTPKDQMQVPDAPYIEEFEGRFTIQRPRNTEDKPTVRLAGPYDSLARAQLAYPFVKDTHHAS